MKIVSLEAENVKCLKAIEIKPDGNLVVIGGDNEAGKSSILDSIEYALGGSKNIPAKPIREGQEKARIVLDLGDMQVVRTFTKNGTNLVVKNKDGSTFATPQAMLDKLVGNLSFDPSEFFRMDNKKRIEILKKLVGLDFTELTKNYKDAFDTRTDINRRGKELKAQYDSLSYCSDVPDKEVSVAELSKRLTDAISKNQKLNNDKRSLENNQLRITKIDEQIKQLMEEKTKIESYMKKDRYMIEDLKEIDVAEIQNNINSAEEINKKVRANDAKKALETALHELRGKSEAISIALKTIDETKQQMMEKAKFPIKGLAFDEETVMFNNIPFDQLSQGARLKISVAMGLVMNPKLKILLIRDGSLLDAKNLEIISKMASKMDAQIWLEKVGRGKDCQIIISDGSIVEQDD